MNPSPTEPVPIIGGGDSEAALVRAATLCDGWINTGAALPEEAFAEVGRINEARKRAGTENRAVLRLPRAPGLPRPGPLPASRGRRRHRPGVRTMDGGRSRPRRHARYRPGGEARRMRARSPTHIIGGMRREP